MPLRNLFPTALVMAQPAQLQGGPRHPLEISLSEKALVKASPLGAAQSDPDPGSAGVSAGIQTNKENFGAGGVAAWPSTC